MSPFTSFAPIYYSCVLFGLAGPWWNHQNKIWHVVCNATFLGNAVVLILLVFSGNRSLPAWNISGAVSVSEYLNDFIIFAYSILDPLVLLLCFLCRRDLRRLFKSLAEIDRLLLHAHVQLNYRMLGLCNWVVWVLLQGYNVVQVCLTIGHVPWTTMFVVFRLFYKQFYHQTPTALVFALTLQVLLRMLALNEGFECICSRQFLNQEYPSSRLMTIAGVLRRPTKRGVYRYGQIHGALCQQLHVIGRCFGVQVVCYVSLYLAFCLMTMYKKVSAERGAAETQEMLLAEIVPVLKMATFYLGLTVICCGIRNEVQCVAWEV